MAQQTTTEPTPAPAPKAPVAKKKEVRRPPTPKAPKQFDPADYDFDDDQTPEASSSAAPEAPADSTPPAASPPAAKPVHSQRMIGMAEELGISRADAEVLSRDELYDEILLKQRQVMAWQENERQQAPRGPLHSPPPAPPEDDLGLTAEQQERFDPEFLALNKRQAKRLKELEDKLAKSEENNQRRDAESRNERIDRAFQGMPELADVFGKGILGELAPDEFECRDIVLGKVAKDQSKASLEHKIQKVARLLASKFRAPAPKVPAQEPEPAYEQPSAKTPPASKSAPTNGSDYEDEELAKRRAIWDQSGTAEPTSRKGASLPKGLEKAKQTFLKLEKEAGRGEDQLIAELTSELPD